ncbi:helix-turn-helix domain-containing protein [Aeromicrobium marinum]|nr:helix-turn-helix transcriptional regulator [Aeromicrobium marinum]
MNASRDHALRVAQELIGVIDQARWDARIGSVRELARRAGMTHTSLNKRMSGEVVFNVRDLAALGAAVGVHPAELITRAVDAALAGNVVQLHPEPSYDPLTVDLANEPSAAEPERRDDESGDDHA